MKRNTYQERLQKCTQLMKAAAMDVLLFAKQHGLSHGRWAPVRGPEFLNWRIMNFNRMDSDPC